MKVIRRLTVAFSALFIFSSFTAGEESLRVKGFYLDMPIKEAQQLLFKYLNKKFEMRTSDDGTSSIYWLSDEGPYTFVDIRADTSGKVTYISFGPDIVDVIFNASGATGRDLAQAFANVFGINFEVYETCLEGWCIYTYRYRGDGIELTIDDNKIFTMKKVGKIDLK